MKIAIIVGHNERQKGAFAPKPINEFEYDWNNPIAEKMVNLARSRGLLTLKKFNRVYLGSYSREIDKVYGEVNAWDPDVSIELHFNAASASASGTLTLSSGSARSLDLAKVMNDKMVASFKLRNRGVIVRGKSERGGRSLHVGRAPAILLEPFFGSNATDRKKANELGIDGMAKMYLEGLEEFYNIESTIPPTNKGRIDDKNVFLTNIDLKTRGIQKSEFFKVNRPQIKKIVTAVNKRMADEAHGEPINELTMVDAVSIMNAEIGLTKSGTVNPNHVHSLGEKGVLPIPSNLKFWVGDIPPHVGTALKAERNVKEFLLYLGAVKNKDVGRTFTGGALYRDLFNLDTIEDDPIREMRVLAGIIHGYYLNENYQNLGLPTAEIAYTSAEANTDQPDRFVTFLRELGYKNAVNGQDIVTNRIDNLTEGQRLA